MGFNKVKYSNIQTAITEWEAERSKVERSFVWLTKEQVLKLVDKIYNKLLED